MEQNSYFSIINIKSFVNIKRFYNIIQISVDISITTDFTLILYNIIRIHHNIGIYIDKYWVYTVKTW